MVYNVEVTDFAFGQLDHYLDYIINELMNPEAAANVLDDFDEAIHDLKVSAGAFKLQV